MTRAGSAGRFREGASEAAGTGLEVPPDGPARPDVAGLTGTRATAVKVAPGGASTGWTTPKPGTKSAAVSTDTVVGGRGSNVLSKAPMVITALKVLVGGGWGRA